MRYGSQIDAINKATGGPAVRYVDPATNKSVVIDSTTNELIMLGEPHFDYGAGSGDAPGAVMRPPSAVRSPPATIIEEELPIIPIVPE